MAQGHSYCHHHRPSRTQGRYRRSIWDFDERYELQEGDLSGIDLSLIGRLQSIEAAKKRTPPVPIAQLCRMAQRLEDLPDPDTVDPMEFNEFLKELMTDVYGMGITAFICTLAVVTDGEFPPMDRKMADGLLSLGLIEAADHTALRGQSLRRFSEVYVRRVLPAWRQRLAQSMSPRQIEAEWARDP